MKRKFKSDVERAASLESAICAWEGAIAWLEHEANRVQQGSARKKAVALVLRGRVSKAKKWLSFFYSGGDSVEMPLDLLG